MKRRLSPWVVVTAAALGAHAVAQAQICRPISQRTAELGCWITANTPLARLPREPVYWHLDTFATRAEAEVNRSERGTVVEAFGKIWLLTLEVAAWRAPGGARVAAIGPLPVKAETRYAAQYMEAVFAPGMTAPTHRHSGPEAWYTLSGETCLETPDGKQVGRPGVHVIVPGGPPMHLTATGTETRRALVLILHDSTQPPTTPDHEWVPKGLCRD